MNSPIVVDASNFQEAWARVVTVLQMGKWSMWNIVVQIHEPSLINKTAHTFATDFSVAHNLIKPDQVAYTIFPFKLYKHGMTRAQLYSKYWKYFKYTRTQPHRNWGTYFERMIRYCPIDTSVPTDQLGNIIDSIRDRKVNYGASYVMVIPYPNKDSKKIMAAPCLNYLTIQVENDPRGNARVNLLAVYRNHDFLERAYGNYYGLCKLLQYVAKETESELGKVTCVSSHAYVTRAKNDIIALATSMIEELAHEQL